MTTHKVADLTGYELNMAVARAEGLSVGPYDMDCAVVAMRERPGEWPEIVHEFDKWKPSTDWSVGGPIIEREGIALSMVRAGEWVADPPWTADFSGPTPLIAAMRAYVASKLGDTVELPDDSPTKPGLGAERMIASRIDLSNIKISGKP